MTTSYTTSTNKNSDEELVAATKSGDEQAFEALVLRHRQRVLAVAHRITRNPEDAEDVAQESLHKAFLHLHNFQEKSRFSTWLTRIVMNQAFMLLRRRRGAVLSENPEDSVNSNLEAFVDQTPDPEESCWQRERTQLLIAAINQLGPKVRRTILLRDMEERSAKETAQILGTSITAVKARVFQGRRKLRRTVSPVLLPGVYEYGRAQAQRC
jgi:RNA polymerase sigma-70 factor (ECF subfamily)